MDMTKLLYYAEYSRNMASGDRLRNLRGVFTAQDLAWYLSNYSESYQYIFSLIRIASHAEIIEFQRKDDM